MDDSDKNIECYQFENNSHCDKDSTFENNIDHSTSQVNVRKPIVISPMEQSFNSDLDKNRLSLLVGVADGTTLVEPAIHH